MTAEQVAPTTGAEWFDRVQPTAREVRVGLILRPDLLERYVTAVDALEQSQLKDGQSRRLAAGKQSQSTRAKAKVVVDLEAEMDATQAWFLLRRLPSDAYQTLKDSNPPRPDNEADRVYGYNHEFVRDEAVRLGMVDPIFERCTKAGCDHTECKSWERFRATLSPVEWEELREGAAEANGAVTEAPKSQRASDILRRRGAASGRPEAGE